MLNKTLPVCLGLFLLACGVRLLVWQNHREATSHNLSGLTAQYRADALNLAQGNLRDFIVGETPPSDARVIAHPPGYSVFLAAVYFIFGASYAAARIIQIALCSLLAVGAFFIARELFDKRAGVIAGALTALSPQLAYNSALLVPDALAVLPLLGSVWVFIKARKQTTLLYAVACGAYLAISCWLRANGLLLPLFFAALGLILLPRGKRISFAASLMATFVVGIAPVTLRNYLAFHAFVPLSLGSGVTAVEGIADYDKNNRFGLPATDYGVVEKEARENNQTGYLNQNTRQGHTPKIIYRNWTWVDADCFSIFYPPASASICRFLTYRPDLVGFDSATLFNPNGVERERARRQSALKVMRENPVWFGSVASRRALSFWRFERVPVFAKVRDAYPPATPIFYYLNLPLKFVQKLFVTAIFLPLLIIGMGLLWHDKTRRVALPILFMIPVYYMTTQSLLHTEYRYVLAIPQLILIVAAFALGAGVNYLQGKYKQNFG